MSAGEPWRQAIAKAEVLLAEGEAAEEISVIADAVSGFNAAVKLAPRAEAPLDWAKTQSRLSAALRALGAEAVAACRAALAVYTLEATPLEWAMASTNLANALTGLDDVASIEEAIAIYRAAIAALDGPARLQQRAIARYNLKRAEERLAALRQTPNDRRR